MSTIRDFYDKYSLIYEKFEQEALGNKEKFPLLYAMRKAERDLLSQGAKKRVFYFTTGSGSDVTYLAKGGAKVFTLDFSHEMIKRACQRLEKNHIQFRLLKNGSEMHNSIDDFFENSMERVLILLADIKEIRLPKDFFDYAFCYCTLPLLGRNALSALKKILFASKNGVVTVYDKEKLNILHKYYSAFGFSSKVKGRTLTIEGGFEYYCIPPSEIREIIERHKKLDIKEVGLGKIYMWSAQSGKEPPTQPRASL